VKSGQFVFGMINGTIQSYQSMNAEQLLTEQEFSKLWKLGKTHSPGTYTYINEQEHVIAYSTVTEESDGPNMGRKGSLNHTVIFKFDDNILNEILSYTDFKQSLAQPMPKLKNPLPEPKIEKTKDD